MIPSTITREHILMAIERIDRYDYPKAREGDIYELLYQNRSYPPKVVVSYANIPANGEELASDDFNAAQARQFLIKAGFPVRIKSNEQPYVFFTPEDLQFFEIFADQPYDPANPILQNAGAFISTLYEKTKLWADLIQMPFSFRVTGKGQWNDRGKKGLSDQRFRHYTWYKLHDPHRDQKLIYYTVGISGKEKQLIIKIDCQRSGQHALQQAQVASFEAFLQERGIRPLRFSVTDITQMNWKSLVDRSVAFITATLADFRTLVDLVALSNKEIYARICWNDNGWVQPSGLPGKSTASKNKVTNVQERDHGFGLEEWLFDLDKIINGCHYSRLEPLNNDKHIGQTYNVTLYSHNAADKTWYWIGKINNATVISKEESAAVATEYRSTHWLQEQEGQLSALTDVNASAFRAIPDTDLFNLKFHPEDVELFDNAPFGEGEKAPSLHYILTDKVDSPKFFDLRYANDLPAGLSLAPRDGRTSKGTIVRRQSALDRELENVHGEIQDHLIVRLRQDFPDINFYPEAVKLGIHSRIDLVGEKPSGDYIFYEIKTYLSVLHSIRVAIGQLLEYALYPGQHLSSEFYIVTHLKAEPIHLSFLRHLSAKIGMQFHYIYFDRQTREYNIME